MIRACNPLSLRHVSAQTAKHDKGEYLLVGLVRAFSRASQPVLIPLAKENNSSHLRLQGLHKKWPSNITPANSDRCCSGPISSED